MSYTFDRVLEGADMETAENRVRKSLEETGFGVLTEIDVKQTMKKKLDVEMEGYKILGACNPQMAHAAIDSEPRIGVMLPCNVILRAVDGGVEVCAVDPLASMSAVKNEDLGDIATSVRDMLIQAVENA